MLPVYIYTGGEHARLSILQDAGERVKDMKQRENRLCTGQGKDGGMAINPVITRMHGAGSSAADTLPTNLEEQE